MRAILSAVLISAGVLAPGAASNAQDPWPCQTASLEARACDMQYTSDLSQCSVLPSGEQAGCNATAAGVWGVCMANITC